MLAAQQFGAMQGKAAQEWVEKAVKLGDAKADNLMEMQLQLFEECKLEDGGRCKELSEAVDALTSAVEGKKTTPEGDGCASARALKGRSLSFQLSSQLSTLQLSRAGAIITGSTPIQLAATKLRTAASAFGPDQEAAANTWIKKLTGGDETSAKGLLEEQITLFGECVAARLPPI